MLVLLYADSMTSNGSGSEQGSLLPTALVGAGILALAGVFIFWPKADESSASREGDSKSQTARSGANGGLASARQVDPAADGSRVESAATRRSRGLAAPEEATPAPEPKTRDEKIAYAEKQLELAEMKVEQIQKGLERYPKIREEALANTDNVEFTERIYDRKKEHMDLNLERARADVDKFSAQLEELEAGG